MKEYIHTVYPGPFHNPTNNDSDSEWWYYALSMWNSNRLDSWPRNFFQTESFTEETLATSRNVTYVSFLVCSFLRRLLTWVKWLLYIWSMWTKLQFIHTILTSVIFHLLCFSSMGSIWKWIMGKLGRYEVIALLKFLLRSFSNSPICMQ